MSDVLLHVTRGSGQGIAENIICGDIAVTDAEGRLLAYSGDPYKYTYMRSCAKPLQASVLLECDGAERFAFSQEEIAVMCASHNAEKFHQETVLSILEKIGLDESSLMCGATYSFGNPAVTEDFIRRGLPQRAIYNNCSGKHCAMLATCIAEGYDTADYYLPDHPVQKDILKAVAGYTLMNTADITVGIDGCGVPVFAMPVFNMAFGYARLAGGNLDGVRGRVARDIVSSMASHPLYVSGTGTFCNELITAYSGSLIAKLGADGVYCIGIVDKNLGIALKIESGGLEHVSTVVMNVLEQLDLLDSGKAELLSGYRCKTAYNCRGEAVGRVIPVFSLRKA